MKRCLLFLMASLACLVGNVGTSVAQPVPPEAEVRTKAPQDKTSTTTQTKISVNGVEINLDTKDNVKVNDHTPLIVEKGQKVKELNVESRVVIIRGIVEGNVNAIKCDLSIEATGAILGSLNMISGQAENYATIHGDVTIADGILHNKPKSSILGKITIDGEVLNNKPLMVKSKNDNRRISAARNNEEPKPKPNWFQSQLFLFMLTLLGGGVMTLVAPKGTIRVNEIAQHRTGPCFGAGIAVTAFMFMVLVIANFFADGFLSVVFAPLSIVAVTCTLLLLSAGWLVGLRMIGERIGKKMGWNTDCCLFYSLALGATFFLLINGVLGSIVQSIGAIGLIAQFILMLIGVGAIVRSGFGKNSFA